MMLRKYAYISVTFQSIMTANKKEKKGKQQKKGSQAIKKLNVNTNFTFHTYIRSKSYKKKKP